MSARASFLRAGAFAQIGNEIKIFIRHARHVDPERRGRIEGYQLEDSSHLLFTRLPLKFLSRDWGPSVPSLRTCYSHRQHLRFVGPSEKRNSFAIVV